MAFRFESHPNEKIPVELTRKLFNEVGISIKQSFSRYPKCERDYYVMINSWIPSINGVEKLKKLFTHPEFTFLSEFFMAKLLKSSLDHSAYLDIILAHPNTNPNTQDLIGATPLGWCTFRGNRSFKKILEHRQTDVNVQNNRGQNVVFFCREPAHVRELLFCGIETEYEDTSGNTSKNTLNSEARGAYDEWMNGKAEETSERLQQSFPEPIWPRDLQGLVQQYVFAEPNN